MADNGELERLRQQAIALSHFGGHALRTHDLDALLQEAAKLVSGASGIELVKVLELLPDGETMLVRAGVNWRRNDRTQPSLHAWRQLAGAVPR